MSKQFLDRADISTPEQHMHCARMSEQVRMDMPIQHTVPVASVTTCRSAGEPSLADSQ